MSKSHFTFDASVTVDVPICNTYEAMKRAKHLIFNWKIVKNKNYAFENSFFKLHKNGFKAYVWIWMFDESANHWYVGYCLFLLLWIVVVAISLLLSVFSCAMQTFTMIIDAQTVRWTNGQKTVSMRCRLCCCYFVSISFFYSLLQFVILSIFNVLCKMFPSFSGSCRLFSYYCIMSWSGNSSSKK